MLLAGEPYLMGSEPAGSGIENLNGYRPQVAYLQLFNHAEVTNVRVDPYGNLGVPASGLLPDTVDLNTVGLAAGVADPVPQSMNKRLMGTTSKA